MGIGMQGDVGDSQRISHKEVCFCEPQLHHLQRLVTFDLFFIKFGAPLNRQAEVFIYIARRRDIGLVAILLEELPLQHLNFEKALCRKKFSSPGEEIQYRAGLCECAAIIKH